MGIRFRGEIGRIGIDIKGKIDRLDNIDRVLGRIAVDMKKETQLNFRNSRGPDGAKWKKLSPITIANRKNQSMRPLINRSTLRRSIRSKVEGKQAIIGSNLKYARIHQYGGEIKPKNKRALRIGRRVIKKVTIPARPYLGYNQRILNRWKGWLVEG